jgi:hypothetical protein
LTHAAELLCQFATADGDLISEFRRKVTAPRKEQYHLDRSDRRSPHSIAFAWIAQQIPPLRNSYKGIHGLQAHLSKCLSRDHGLLAGICRVAIPESQLSRLPPDTAKWVMHINRNLSIFGARELKFLPMNLLQVRLFPHQPGGEK